MQTKAKEKMAIWLDSQDWQYYCTFTTKYTMSMGAARRSMERLAGQASRFGDLKMFWVAEPFDTRYGYHTHALMSLEPHNTIDKQRAIQKAWQIASKGGRGKEYNHTVIKEYEKGLGAHNYIVKYLQRKNADYDYFFSDGRAPQAQTPVYKENDLKNNILHKLPE